MNDVKNPVGLDGIEFVEFASPDSEGLKRLFRDFGMAVVMQHGPKNISLMKQNDIHFLVNESLQSHAGEFKKQHGPSVPSMGWRVKDADHALRTAVARGAKEAKGDYQRNGKPVNAIFGIGGILLFFIV
jgi:4-hydroxyphenylpyruvate dioxygenase